MSWRACPIVDLGYRAPVQMWEVGVQIWDMGGGADAVCVWWKCWAELARCHSFARFARKLCILPTARHTLKSHT
jgi:hypothetical protein